jgi:hypothetical protein
MLGRTVEEFQLIRLCLFSNTGCRVSDWSRACQRAELPPAFLLAILPLAWNSRLITPAGACRAAVISAVTGSGQTGWRLGFSRAGRLQPGCHRQGDFIGDLLQLGQGAEG